MHCDFFFHFVHFMFYVLGYNTLLARVLMINLLTDHQSTTRVFHDLYHEHAAAYTVHGRMAAKSQAAAAGGKHAHVSRRREKKTPKTTPHQLYLRDGERVHEGRLSEYLRDVNGRNNCTHNRHEYTSVTQRVKKRCKMVSTAILYIVNGRQHGEQYWW